MDQRNARLRRIFLLALLLCVLSVVIVLVSAYIRLYGAGLGCTPWPDCYGQILSGGPHPQAGGVRLLHRVVASLALFLGFGLLWQSLRPQPLAAPKGPASALLVLMLLLTLVGVFSADPHRVWAGIINMVGGAALVLLSWRTALAARIEPPPAGGQRGTVLVHAGLGFLVFSLLIGAVIGARYAAPACPTLPGCGDIWWPAAGSLAVLNPLTSATAPLMLGDDGGTALHLLHRYCALVTLVLLGLGAIRGLTQAGSRSIAAVVLVLLLLQFGLGVSTVLGGFALWLAVAHSVGAAALLAAGMHLLLRLKAVT